jgi:hypothetical protein
VNQDDKVNQGIDWREGHPIATYTVELASTSAACESGRPHIAWTSEVMSLTDCLASPNSIAVFGS